MKQDLLTLDAGFRYCMKVFESLGIQVLEVKNVNNGRHKYVETKVCRFCYLYKRAYFGSYSRQFEEGKQVGESINVDRLYWCIDNNIDYILFGYQDMKIYAVKPLHFLQWANKHHTYRKVEKKDIRKDFGKDIEIEEVTASIDIKQLIRFDEVIPTE